MIGARTVLLARFSAPFFVLSRPVWACFVRDSLSSIILSTIFFSSISHIHDRPQESALSAHSSKSSALQSLQLLSLLTLLVTFIPFPLVKLPTPFLVPLPCRWGRAQQVAVHYFRPGFVSLPPPSLACQSTCCLHCRERV